MGVAPLVYECPSNRPALTTLPGARRNFRLPVNAPMRAEKPVSGAPVNLNVNRRFASTMTADEYLASMQASAETPGAGAAQTIARPDAIPLVNDRHHPFLLSSDSFSTCNDKGESALVVRRRVTAHESVAGRCIRFLRATSRQFGEQLDEVALRAIRSPNLLQFTRELCTFIQHEQTNPQ